MKAKYFTGKFDLYNYWRFGNTKTSAHTSIGGNTFYNFVEIIY